MVSTGLRRHYRNRAIRLAGLASVLLVSVASLAFAMTRHSEDVAATVELELPPPLTGIPGVARVAVDPNTGDLWIATLDINDPGQNRLYRYHQVAQRLESWPLPPEWGSGVFFSMAVDRNGTVWAAWGKSIVRFDPTASTMNVFDTRKMGSNAQLRALAVDSRNRIWFSLFGSPDALFQLVAETGDIRVLSMSSDIGIPTSILELPGGNLLLALEGHPPVASKRGIGLTGAAMAAEVNPHTGQVQTRAWPSAALAVSRDGRVWAVGGGESLARLDPASEQRETVQSGIGTGGSDLVVTDPLRNVVWFTGMDLGSRPARAALVRYDVATQQMRKFLLPRIEIESTFSGDHGPAVRHFRPDALTVDAQGNAWIIDVGWPGQRWGMVPGQ